VRGFNADGSVKCGGKAKSFKQSIIDDTIQVMGTNEDGSLTVGGMLMRAFAQSLIGSNSSAPLMTTTSITSSTTSPVVVQVSQPVSITSSSSSPVNVKLNQPSAIYSDSIISVTSSSSAPVITTPYLMSSAGVLRMQRGYKRDFTDEKSGTPLSLCDAVVAGHSADASVPMSGSAGVVINQGPDGTQIVGGSSGRAFTQRMVAYPLENYTNADADTLAIHCFQQERVNAHTLTSSQGVPEHYIGGTYGARTQYVTPGGFYKPHKEEKDFEHKSEDFEEVTGPCQFLEKACDEVSESTKGLNKEGLATTADHP